MHQPLGHIQIPEHVHHEIINHLGAGERLLWLSKPIADGTMTGLQKVCIITGSVAITIFAVLGLLTWYWGFFSNVAPIAIAGFSIAFGLIFGAFGNRKMLERLSTYVLTDRRAMSLLYDNEMAILTSVPLAATTTVHFRNKSASVGNVTFSRIHKTPLELTRIAKLLPVRRRESKLTFVGVPQPQYVVQIALWVAAQNRDFAA